MNLVFTLPFKHNIKRLRWVSWCEKFIATDLFSIGGPRGVMVKAMDCGIVVNEFELQSRYYVQFQANTLLG